MVHAEATQHQVGQGGSRKTILLVDDEPLIRRSLARDLVNDAPNFTVSQAASGEEAIARIDSGQWDLVITDLVMPGLDGFQVLKTAKRRNASTMVIILTGYGDMQAAIDALRLGADDFLQKPIDSDELLFRMANCLVKQDLLRKVELYEAILPVCSYCKKIRVAQQTPQDKDWYSLEEYLLKMKGVRVSHGCCPACFDKQMADLRHSLTKKK
jgi:YesN/AraC family two-component response regulator